MLLLFFMHVRSGIHMDQEAHTGNDQQKQGRKLVYLECKRNSKITDPDKIKIIGYISIATPYFCKYPNTDKKRYQHRTTP